ncbi:toprim domain-containing protein [Methylocystis echinoides]|uniref:toprim domain-containing protein n=1 Tax=Methylocystis echinoides TaxID=29468 RepID=UPI00341A1AB4
MTEELHPEHPQDEPHKESGYGGTGNGHTTLSVEEAFAAAIEAKLEYGPDEIIADGEIHRFGESGEWGKQPGWYVLHADDPQPFGMFGDWRTGEKYPWRGQETRPLTPEERAERDRQRAERNSEEAKKQRAAAREAEKIHRKGQEYYGDALFAKFPYFRRKNVQAHSGVAQIDVNKIAIPIYDHEDARTTLVSLQYITATGDKRFLPDGKIKGCWFEIGLRQSPNRNLIVVVEGYATGATIHETSGLPVIVAFNAGNLEAVAKKIAAKYPNALIIIAGDDDYKTELKLRNNTGVESAKAAAKAVGGVAVFPPFDRAKDGDEPSDWNDLATLIGKDKLAEIFRQTVEEAKQHREDDPPPAPPPPPRDLLPPPPDDAPPPPPGDQTPPDDPDGKATIYISADMDVDLIACAKALIESRRVEIFQRGGSLVMRGIIKGKSHTGAELHDDAIITHCTESLRVVLAAAADFYRLGKKGFYVKCYPPLNLAAALAKCSPLIGHFPILRGLTSIPIIRADGTILDKPGYDPATGIYYDPKGIDFGDMPHDATMADAETALQKLEVLIKDFPFKDEASRSVALARILTGVARSAMKVAMMFLYDAPAPRTGKSKLNDIASMIISGHEAPVISATDDKDERAKQLVSALRGGSQTITLDNLPNGEALESELLCQMLTQERVEVRAFCTNDKMIVLPNIATVVANGNNIGVGADMTERTCLCRLDAKMEFPGERKFDFDPVEVVRADRAKYVRLCLTVLRAHALAGYPKSDELSPVGGFEEWSKFVRAGLAWLNRADPCESMKAIRESDPQRGSLETIMEHWHKAFGISPKTAADAIKYAEDMAKGEYKDEGGSRETVREANGEFLAAISEVAAGTRGGVSPVSFGKWLKKNVGVVIGDLRFYSPPQGKHKGSGKVYHLVTIKEEDEIRAHGYGGHDGLM